MAFITLHSEKLKQNFEYLDQLFHRNDIKWSVVTKLLCGEQSYIRELLKLDINQICDSRVTNLKVIKSIKPEIETIYIKPPAKRSISNVIKYADISVNTEYNTIKLLSEEAKKQNKKHKILIMIELGELREGVLRDEFIHFFSKVFDLENIEVVGIGANLACMTGVLPNHDKLIQLSLYEQLIEAKFERHIPYVSGGSSVTIPLIYQNLLPMGINHFRVGETLFLGTNVYNNTTFANLNDDVFMLYAEIIELIEKPKIPMGEMGTNVEGDTYSPEKGDIGATSHRAILDVGLLDVEQSHIFPVDKKIQFSGASSDMLVVDLADNKKKYKVGDLIKFSMNYMGVLRILNSKYIEKKIL